ncbi:MAG: hypothetical protein HZB54_08860 [Deltaproteobacteria bacterium]|nr:hypothetical protein [Deltaproteobacteria bacterium]
MKKLLFLAVAAAIALAFGGTSFAATTIQGWQGAAENDYPGSQLNNAAAGQAAGGIVWSRHNLSSFSSSFQASLTALTSGQGGYTTGDVATTEVCVFCHTPHHAGSATAPLWNRNTTASFTAYGTTVGGTNITSVGGSSLACLSCHDGVTTLDALINAPGKGSNTNGLTTAQAWAFLDDAGAVLIGTTVSPNISDKARLNIGTDLSNDHPISVSYQADRASLRATSTTISGITINNAQNFGGGAGAYGRSDNIWAVKGYLTTTATIQSLLRNGDQVQCASCHDPHYKNQTNNDPAVVLAYGAGYVVNAGDSDGLFLRRVGGNSNSGVCRTCHAK